MVNTEGHEFLSEDLPRDLDWFMIKTTDYENTTFDQNTEQENDNFLPAIGIFESVLLCSVVAVFSRNMASENRKDESQVKNTHSYTDSVSTGL